MKIKNSLILIIASLFIFGNVIADTIKFDLRNSIFDATIGLSGKSIDSTAKEIQTSLLSNYDVSFSFDYGAGWQDFQVVNENIHFNGNAIDSTRYTVGYTGISLDLIHAQTGDQWIYEYNWDYFPGNTYDDYMYLSNITSGGGYVDQYAPYYWRATVVPVPGAIYLFVSALAVLGITGRSGRFTRKI